VVRTEAKLTRRARHDVLLDSAAALLETGGATAVTMEAVAGHAGVSRPLVYKHFANRDDLVVALFRRESAAFDDEVAAALRGVEGLDAVVRTSAQAIVEGFGRRRKVLGPLLQGDSIDPALRAAQRERTVRNNRWYRDYVVAACGIDPERAQVAVTILFGGLVALISTGCARFTGEERARVIDTYVEMVMGGLERLSSRPTP
jgi:AcrR family transcriptional regulator